MKTKFHAVVLCVLCFAGGAAVLRADQNLAGNVTVTGGSTSGNLIVTGTVEVNGSGLTLGTQDSSFGAGLLYSDSSSDTFNFFLNRDPASWLWQHSSIVAMRLDAAHKLLLYQTDGSTLGVSIDPSTHTLSLGSAALYRGGNGALKTDGAFEVGGNFTAPTYTATNGTLTGGTTGLTLNAGGTNQSITFSATGTGSVVFNSPVRINDTSMSTSTSTGALVVTGGVGAGGSVNVNGAITASSVTVSGALSGSSASVSGTVSTGSLNLTGPLTGGNTGLTLNAGGNDQHITLTPSGSGFNRLQGAGTQVSGTVLFGTVVDSANGRLQLAAHTAPSGGIGFGSDTVLYRSAPGVLKTDGKLAVTGDARFDGAIRVAPQGDLSMGEFTSEP